MSTQIIVNGVITGYSQLIFGGGENHIRLENPELFRHAMSAMLTLVFNHDRQIIELLQITDAIRRINPHIKLTLRLPYFPGARQDRVCFPGECLSVKIYADLINSQNYDKVIIFDPHSEVTPALIKNVEVIGNESLVENTLHLVLKGDKKVTLISPDAGSNKKIYKVAAHLAGYFKVNVVRADKIRETEHGKVIGTEVFADDLKGEDVFIVDDICSKGGTFMALASELKKKNAGYIYLIVSHYEGTATTRLLQNAGITRLFMAVNLQNVPTEPNGFLYDHNMYGLK